MKHFVTCSVLLVCLSPPSVDALAPWSWATMQTYVHCCNISGPWNEAALSVLQTKAFVVQERQTGRLSAPLNHSTESKMIAAHGGGRHFDVSLAEPDILLEALYKVTDIKYGVECISPEE